MSTNIQIVLPKGALGSSDTDDMLDSAIRVIANANTQNPEGEWSDKYGINITTPIFVMHRYCWCEREDCAWCGGCNCDDSKHSYAKNGKIIDSETWHKEWNSYSDEMPLFAGLKFASKEYKAYDKKWHKRIDERNKIYTFVRNPTCDFCLNKGIFAENGADAGMGAPNFWYKPLDFKVWWYKYIGRDMRTNKTLSSDEIRAMVEECLGIK
jgi:hypothetical protein